MGNNIGRRRYVVEEKYTRPQGLYETKDLDYKKLRRLILGSKLAPCYPGEDDANYDLEACPICFLHYPSLNRATCCRKAICTECFIQIKPPSKSHPRQCPFCRSSYYVVEYRGARTKKEKEIEETEEQRVIEAQIKMRQRELQEQQDRMKKGQKINLKSTVEPVIGAEYINRSNSSLSASVSQGLLTVPERSYYMSNQNRDAAYVEDIMDIGEIWLSIHATSSRSENNEVVTTSSSVNELQADLQHLNTSTVDSSESIDQRMDAMWHRQRLTCRECSTSTSCGSSDESQLSLDHGSVGSDAATSSSTSHTSSVVAEGISIAVNHIGGGFEEQMMLNMAVSLAGGRFWGNLLG